MGTSTVKLLKFTRPDGSAVWIVNTWIISVSLVTQLERQGRALTRIQLSGEIQDVREPIDEVIADMRAAE
jgi:hypothetical protein